MLLNKKSSLVAVGGIGSALSVVLLLVATLLPAGKLAFVFVSSVIVGLLICFGGVKAALIHYVSVALLGILFLPDKTLALLYAVVVGNYPFVKRLVERIPSTTWRIVVKLVVFNAYMYVGYMLCILLLNIDFTTGYPIAIVWICALVAFVIYDYIYMPFVYKAYDLINKI